MTQSVTESLTVLFLPESAHGPTNQCIGLGKVLLDRGHRLVFAAERSWEGKLAPLGFVEALVDLAPAAPDVDPDAGEEAARPALDRLHQRDVARVPQADGRAAVVVRGADVPSAR
jgi:UDP:flavonoid glycosyltransferase YjiC (YdhE family)